MQWLMIAIGGAIGASLRYAVSLASFALFGRAFPYGTLCVNVLGSFLIGLLYIIFLERMMVSPELRAFLLIGVLGAFTTFSSFSLETLNLVEMGQLLAAISNIILNVCLCLLAVWLGSNIGKML